MTMTSSPLSLMCQSTVASLKAGQESTIHVLVRVKAPTPPAGQRARPKLSAVLALDVSGSMQGLPLTHVIRSTERIVELLSDGDAVGVVAFSSLASVVAPLAPLDASTRRRVQSAVRQLQAEGGTNISEGMKQSARLFPARQAGEQQMVLLLSDGQPNVGPSGSRELGAESAEIKARGVAVGTLGYGSSHDEKILINIAEMGGGRYAFVSEPQLAEASFVQALGTQLDIVAEGPRLVLTPSEDADIVRVLGDHRTSVGADGLRVSLRDLAVGEEVNVVVEVRVRAWREGSWKALYASLTAQEGGGKGQLQAQAAAEIQVTADGPRLLNAEALGAVSVALADEERTKARALADKRDFAGAAQLLRQALKQLEATPGFRRQSGDRMDDAYDALLDDVTVYEQRPDAERYAHYSKAQQDYLSLAHGGASNRVMSPAAQQMSARRNAGPLPRARLTVLSGGKAGHTHAITDVRVVIGRGSSSDLVVPSEGISRQHAIVELVGSDFWVVDLGSTNGVEIGGQRVARKQLATGDTFQVGDVQIRFERD